MATPIRFGTEFLVNTTVVSGQSFSTSTALADGRFVVSWTDVSSSGGDPTGFAVRAQVYNADGTKSEPNSWSIQRLAAISTNPPLPG